MGQTYGIDKEEFLDGHIHFSKNEETDRYGFEDFLRNFEGDVSAETLADAWNELARKHNWQDNLQAINKYSKKPLNYEDKLFDKISKMEQEMMKDVDIHYIKRCVCFVKHIEKHLNYLKIKGLPMCKICERDINEIWEHENKEKEEER